MFRTDKKNESENKREVSNSEAYGFAILAVVAMMYVGWQKNIHKIETYYFQNFEEIYLIGYGVIVFIVMLVIFLIRKKTRDMDSRVHLLSPLWVKKDENIEVGKTDDGIDLFLSDKDRCSHVQVIGTTGRGKTKSVVVPWTIRDLKRGKSVVIIDGKGANDLPQEIFDWIDRSEINCMRYHFNLDNPDLSVKINPLRHGSPQQITDRIFSSFEFDDPFYKSVQYDICGYLTRLIIETEGYVSFKLLYELLTEDQKLSKILGQLSDNNPLKFKLKNYLRQPAKDRLQKIAGLISQLSPFANSEIADIVNGDSRKDTLHHLMMNSNEPKIFIFSIPTLKYQKLGHQLGKLILQELAFCVGVRENKKDNNFTSVFLDEFSEFVYDGFISILNKARSAKVGLHLCHQSLSDLTAISESFSQGVNTNTNIKCILGLNEPETADFYARHFGTVTTSKFTEQMQDGGLFNKFEETGRASRREVESYKIHPNILKELYQGRGVLHLPTASGVVTELIKFKMFSESELERASC